MNEPEISFQNEEDKARYEKDPKEYTGIIYAKGLPSSAVIDKLSKLELLREAVYLITKAVLVSTLALFCVFVVLLCYLVPMSESDTVHVILTNLIFK